MDGHYLNKADEFKVYLRKWVDSSIQMKSWEKHDDLHLDQIDYCFKSDGNWVDGALFIYSLLSEIISERPYRCLLVIPLSYSESKTNLNNLSHSFIKKELDITPPSFYLFPYENADYERTLIGLAQLDALSNEINLKAYFKEEQTADNEYFRCIYV